MQSFFFLGLSASLLAVLVGADAPFFADTALYNSGALGGAPNQTFFSSDIVAPRFQVNKLDLDGIDKTPFLFLDYVCGDKAAAMIFNSTDLSLVYADTGHKHTNDVRVQTINGKNYLTFFSGVFEGTHGNGRGRVLDEAYKPVYNITPIGLTSGRLSDEHELQFTAEGNAVIIVYEEKPMDLSPIGGPKEGVLLDQLFQEINPNTGELLFEWRVSDHFDIKDSMLPYAINPRANGYDSFHMNSLAKYGTHYLVSGRNFHSVMLINGTDGSPIWTLGGKHNQFKDISGGKTAFSWQHNTRLISESDLTMFDNHVAEQLAGCRENCTRAKHLKLDFDRMTVELVEEHYHPMGLRTFARGGYTTLKSGNALVAWGTQPGVTEYKDGKVVMDIQLGPLRSEFVPNATFPYRAFKFDWAGRPSWDPSIAVDGETAYVSWNGGVRVDGWQIMGSETSTGFNSNCTVVARARREGFETAIPLGPMGDIRFVRAAALDREGKLLAYSSPVARENT